MSVNDYYKSPPLPSVLPHCAFSGFNPKFEENVQCLVYHLLSNVSKHVIILKLFDTLSCCSICSINLNLYQASKTTEDTLTHFAY